MSNVQQIQLEAHQDAEDICNKEFTRLINDKTCIYASAFRWNKPQKNYFSVTTDRYGCDD